MPRTSETVPLYARIAGVLRQRIDVGELAVGAMLPTLEAFMEEFGASRVTMRLAMNMLEAEHLISRKRGFGTVVLARPRAAQQIVLPNTWEDLLSRLADISRTLIRVELSAIPSADELNVDAHPTEALNPTSPTQHEGNDSTEVQYATREDPRYVRMLARHDHGQIAYCYVDAWLEASLYKASKRALKSRPALRVLVDAHPDRIARVQQSTTLALADLDAANSLEIPIGSPIALVRRTVFDADANRVYASRVSFPASVVRWDALLIKNDAK